MLGLAVTATQRKRPIEDRFALRYPVLATRVNGLVNRIVVGLPRHWPVRQRLAEYAARRSYDALTRGDLAVLRTMHHPDVTYDLSRWEWPEETLYHGLDGVVRFNGQWISQWSEMDFSLVSVEELDQRGVLLIHVHLRGIGRTSGLALERDDFVLVELRDGLVWRGTMFLDRESALEMARVSVSS